MSVYPDTLVAFKEDIEHKGLVDWLKAHTSFMRPLHRYAGELVLDTGKLFFTGMDEQRNEHFELTIPRAGINGIYLGYDHIFKRIDDRSLGLFHFVPLRIDFTIDHSAQSIYLFANYSRLLRQSDNQQLYEELGGN